MHKTPDALAQEATQAAELPIFLAALDIANHVGMTRHLWERAQLAEAAIASARRDVERYERQVAELEPLQVKLDAANFRIGQLIAELALARGESVLEALRREHGR